jgi:hypothetical protein
MIGHRLCNPAGEIGVVWMKGQERFDRAKEILNVLGLGLFTAAGIGFLPLGVPVKRMCATAYNLLDSEQGVA